MKKILLFLSISVTMLTADIYVVVSENSMLTKLDKHEIERLFLDKTRYYPDGSKAVVIEGATKNIKEHFYATVANKSKSQLRSYWAKQIFTGKRKPPKKLKGEKLFDYLAQNPHAITYISSEEMSDSLKVIYKIKQ